MMVDGFFPWETIYTIFFHALKKNLLFWLSYLGHFGSGVLSQKQSSFTEQHHSVTAPSTGDVAMQTSWVNVYDNILKCFKDGHNSIFGWFKSAVQLVCEKGLNFKKLIDWLTSSSSSPPAHPPNQKFSTEYRIVVSQEFLFQSTESW